MENIIDYYNVLIRNRHHDVKAMSQTSGSNVIYLIMGMLKRLTYYERS